MLQLAGARARSIGLPTFRVLNDPRRLALHHRNSRVCGTQVNTNDLALDLLIATVGIAPPEGRCEGRFESGGPKSWRSAHLGLC